MTRMDKETQIALDGVIEKHKMIDDFQKRAEEGKVFEMCSCGHFGGMSRDSHNAHEANIQAGHGKCKLCKCTWFTWVGFCNAEGEIEK